MYWLRVSRNGASGTWLVARAVRLGRIHALSRLSGSTGGGPISCISGSFSDSSAHENGASMFS